jgi:hypothetical protein
MNVTFAPPRVVASMVDTPIVSTVIIGGELVSGTVVSPAWAEPTLTTATEMAAKPRTDAIAAAVSLLL